MKKEKYKVTGVFGFFGLTEKESILDCFVLANDGKMGLVYIPANRELECGCLELCQKDKDLCWISIGTNNYVNIVDGKINRDFLKLLKKLDKRK